jgi:flagellar hook-associated protein 1
LANEIDTLASVLITKVNELHAPGYALDGTSTGENFFSGTSASTITLNSVIAADPSRIQASSDGNPGNNGVALGLARLGNDPLTELGELTFGEKYNQTVANFGQALNNVTSQLLDQRAVNRMLERQRDSLGGVSIDEEMTNLIIFQRAFQASARMVNTLDELLQNVINLTR